MDTYLHASVSMSSVPVPCGGTCELEEVRTGVEMVDLRSTLKIYLIYVNYSAYYTSISSGCPIIHAIILL